MVPVGQAEMERALREAGPEAVCALVTALYDRCGYDATRVGPDRVCLDRDGHRSTVVVFPDASTDLGDADCVVALDPLPDLPPGVTVVDAEAIRHRLLYAIDREACSTLVETYLDRPLSSFEGTTDESKRRSNPGECGSPGSDGVASSGEQTERIGAGGSETTVDRARQWRSSDADRVAWVAVATISLLAVVVVILAVVAPGGSFAVAPDTPEGGGPDTSSQEQAVLTPSLPASEAVGVAPLVSPTERQTPTGERNPPFSGLPPGVNAAGVINESRVAWAHTRTLANRTYRVDLTYREFVDGSPTGFRREVVRAANATTYSARVQSVGEFTSTPPTLVPGAVYANGRTLFERTPEGVRTSPVAETRGPTRRLRRYLLEYLSVRDSTLSAATARNGVTAYWLTLDGDSDPGVANTTGSVLVDRRGVVHELRRAYRLSDRPSVSVVVTVRVSAIDETSVTRPDWLSEPTATPRARTQRLSSRFDGRPQSPE